MTLNKEKCHSVERSGTRNDRDDVISRHNFKIAVLIFLSIKKMNIIRQEMEYIKKLTR